MTESPGDISDAELAEMAARLQELQIPEKVLGRHTTRTLLPLHRPIPERLQRTASHWKDEGYPDISIRAVEQNGDLLATEGSHRLFLAKALGLPVSVQVMDPESEVPLDDPQFRWLASRRVGRENVGTDLAGLTWGELAQGLQRARESQHWNSKDLAYQLPVKISEHQHKMASVLTRPGTFTKRANLRYLLAALAGAPIVGAATGLYQDPGHPMTSAIGGGTGGTAGGLVGAGTGAAAMALLQAIAKKQIDPNLLAQAATLGAAIGAVQGGREGADAAVGVTGAPQEALLAAILDEMQEAKRPPPYRPDLLR